jgi:hypothetical protein
LFKAWSLGVGWGHNEEKHFYMCQYWKKSFSPELVGQFQSNLVHIIFAERELKFVQINGQVLFKGEIIAKMQKYSGFI